MSRKSFLAPVALGAFLALHALADEQRPNVLLLLVDDLKPAIGAYGDPLAITPNIDQLAQRAVRFDSAYCNQSVCAPSRNNLLLGSRSTSLGIYSLSQNFRRAVPDAVTLPQYFMRHGYRAEALGKILHVGHGNVDDRASWSVDPVPAQVVEYLLPESTAGGQLTREEAYFSNRELGNIRALPRGAAWEAPDVEDQGYADGRVAEEGIRRLEAAKAREGAPFFLALGFVKPHLPFTAPKKYWDLHDPAKFNLPPPSSDPIDAPGFAGKRGGEIVNYAPLSVDNLQEETMWRTLIHGYYASASYADAQIGKILDALERLELTDHTIVVLWGDHGWHLGDHGYWTKHTNYEQANRIPILFAGPGVTAAGQATEQLAETVDIYPTLVELAGLPIPQVAQPLDGVSLVPTLRDPQARVRDHAAHCYPRGPRIGRAIRTERYRMIEWKSPGASREEAVYELYDYTTDPHETRNIADTEPATLESLQAILDRHPEAKAPLRGRH